jgi:HEAT repeat protein
MAMTRKRLLRIGFYGFSGLIFLYVLLNPYSRQSIFGPTIQGEPLCYWQNEIRRGADPNPNKEPVMMKLLAFIGIKPPLDTLRLGHANWLSVALSLIDDPSPTVRADVAIGLARYGESPEAIDGLVRLLDDPDAKVRAAAAYACGQPEAARALPKLTKLLDDSDPLCRARAAGAVWEASGDKPKRVVAVLAEVLHDTDADARKAACEGLLRMGKDAAQTVPQVVAAVSSEPNVYWRAHIIRFLGRFGPDSVPYLIGATRDSNAIIRSSAASALGDQEEPALAAVPALFGLLSDGNSGVRESAWNSLSKIDPIRYPEMKADH